MLFQLHEIDAIRLYLTVLIERPSEDTLRAMCYVCDNHLNNQNVFRIAGGFEFLYKILNNQTEMMRSLRHRSLIVLCACCRSNPANLDYLCQSV